MKFLIKRTSQNYYLLFYFIFDFRSNQRSINNRIGINGIHQSLFIRSRTSIVNLSNFIQVLCVETVIVPLRFVVRRRGRVEGVVVLRNDSRVYIHRIGIDGIYMKNAKKLRLETKDSVYFKNIYVVCILRASM